MKPIAFVAPMAAVAFITSAALPAYAATPSSTFTGIGTFYEGNGAGACGMAFDENAEVVALEPTQFTKALCGKTITITNDLNGEKITAKVADKCAGCIDGVGLSLADEGKLGGLLNLPQIDTWDTP